MTQTLPQLESQAETAALHALLTSAAFAPLPNLGWLRVTGSDRVRWLNGMVTNNIAALKPGEGNYSFVLNAQGRIQADITAFLLEDSILLQTVSPTALATLLDRFIIMDDVELTPLDAMHGLLIAGPDARTIVMNLGATNQQAAPCSTPAAALPQSLNLKQTAYANSPVILIQAHSPLIPRFEIWSDPATIALILTELRTTPALPASADDLEHLRLLEGTPLYATDIRNSDSAKDLPQETAQTRALHFAKGCYLGQEIVERIRSRGNVHRTFTGFVLTGTLPAAGTPLTGADGKAIGELTSVAQIHLPQGPIQLALGYIRREALEPSTARADQIHYPGGTATPTTLPFAVAASQTAPSTSEQQNPQE